MSKMQPMVSLSSIEHEYKSACFVSYEAIWLRWILGDMGAVKSKPTLLLCDIHSCMAIVKNPMFHTRTKHIEIQYHFLHELIMDGEVNLVYCAFVEIECYRIFTKALGRDLLERHLHRLGIGPKKSSSPGSGH